MQYSVWYDDSWRAESKSSRLARVALRYSCVRPSILRRPSDSTTTPPRSREIQTQYECGSLSTYSKTTSSGRKLDWIALRGAGVSNHLDFDSVRSVRVHSIRRSYSTN